MRVGSLVSNGLGRSKLGKDCRRCNQSAGRKESAWKQKYSSGLLCDSLIRFVLLPMHNHLFYFPKRIPIMKKYGLLALRILTAVILFQTLYFKFSAHPDSVYIFTKVGMEPFGRIGIGILELISGILLLIPRTVWAGALLTLGIISGAILMHLTMLGIDVQGDGGALFYTAVLVFVLAAVILWVQRKEVPILGRYV